MNKKASAIFVLSVFLISLSFVFDFNEKPEAYAAQGDNHTDIVVAVKTNLIQQGVDISGCGTLKIVIEVAWQLRGEGAGLLYKPGGYNCQKYASDIIAYPNGNHYDILNSSLNPQWIPVSCINNPNCNSNLYRSAFDPAGPVPDPSTTGPGPQPPPPPGPGPQPPPGPGPGPQPPPDPGPGPEPPPQPLPSEPVPQIIGANPNKTKPGDHVEIIGLYLTQTIVLIPVNGGAETRLSAELNSGKTIAKITIPSEIDPGNYSVRADGQSVSYFYPNLLTVSAPPIEHAPGTLEIKNFGDLVEEIFRWALALVGAAVFVNFLWAGFLWFTAAGRPGPIGQAKEKMFNSLIGAIILLASYIILNTINPDLVKSVITLPGL